MKTIKLGDNSKNSFGQPKRKKNPSDKNMYRLGRVVASLEQKKKDIDNQTSLAMAQQMMAMQMRQEALKMFEKAAMLQSMMTAQSSGLPPIPGSGLPDLPGMAGGVPGGMGLPPLPQGGAPGGMPGGGMPEIPMGEASGGMGFNIPQGEPGEMYGGASQGAGLPPNM